MSRFLLNKGALVTGGLTGVGLAIAEGLAEAGANVAVGSFVNPAMPDFVKNVRERLEPFGTKVFAGHLDVRNSGLVREFVSEAQVVCGPIDILVNAAGICFEQPVSGHSDELWDRILDTNLNGAFRAMRETMPGMISRRWGRIINIGSTYANVGWADNPAYCASKSGMLGLTRCAALEGAPHGVTCVMISPSGVDTEMTRRTIKEISEREGKGRTPEDVLYDIIMRKPQKRLLQPSELAALATFLCREEAGSITMENIQVTGGSLT
ncbi:3-oxoacyl-ACP reductase [Mesorhizobium hawassense]|uniref:3-oxoacyl-ACP reductase n=1 Tax=Mesorhizobium hawassense TaxID=1209954 RepID=A0A330HUC4_9HYPH|nr:SDR family NAD(P)-dependent oxidoreductase [Mesorhizobium hawassense]RAZ92241.1 3-oxoacyl-ACP reductase [Mesorhizobium hawassense]